MFKVFEICFELTLYVSASFVEFYMFDFDEIHVRGFNLMMIIFGLETSGKLSPRTTKGSSRTDPKSVCRLSQADPTEQSMASLGCDAPSKGPVMRYLDLCKEWRLGQPLFLLTEACDGASRW